MSLRPLNSLSNLCSRQLRSCLSVTRLSLISRGRFQLKTIIQTPCRWKTVGRPAAKPASKTQFPGRLLVYHVGTGKTTLVGCVKVSTIFAFAFACLVQGPALYKDAKSPEWLAPLAIVAGAVPMVLVGWLTRPFVSTIHLRLPMEAQRSKDRVMKFTQLLPPNATLEITAMRFLPWPKSIGTKVSELRPFKSMRAPLANLERIPEKTTAFKIPHRKFFVDENVGSKGSRAPGAWENIMRQIRRNAAKA